MSDKMPDTLLIPVETLNREFDAKLLLALRSKMHGFRPIIGGRTVIHDRLPQLPRSIYLAKGIRTGNRLKMSILNDLAHIIVALDEEALIRINDEALMLMLDEETFNRPRLLFAWGRSNADVWKRYDGYRGTPIIEAGNPRIDLLRPELRDFHSAAADKLRERFGRFVLLSSNFSAVNHFIPDHLRFRVAPGAPKQRTDELKSGLRNHKQALFDRFRALVPALASAIAPASLVIRPHPSENAATWSALRAGHDNVHVIHEGPIAPWLMAASALLHNGCTSAVEAAVLGTPAFAYRPTVNPDYDPVLPDALSMPFAEDGPLIEALTEHVNGTREPPGLTAGQRSLLAEHIASVDGELSVDRILAALTERRDELGGGHGPNLSDRLSGYLRHYLRGATRQVTTRLRGGKSSGRYVAHKFPGISEAEVNARIARFRRIMPELPALQARQRLPNVFELEPA